jgi:protein-L-isoaspartate(D-aspartate) O-methyltransferase
VLLAIAAQSIVCSVVGAADSAHMLDQLKARGIRDARVLDAFRRVPREAFVPAELRDRAYDDAPLAIGHGQTVSQPYMVALMTELLDLKGGERVLEIGTGSGYQAAILAVLAREVYSVEIIPALATAARLRLTREGYRNVHVKLGDGTRGWREYGPYDAIVVTAAASSVPRPLIEQLREGGVLVMPVGDEAGRQVLVRGVKRAGKLRTREITEVRFVPMTGEAGRRGAPSAERERSQPSGRAPARSDEHDDNRPRGGSPAQSDENDRPRTRAPAASDANDDDRPRGRGVSEEPRGGPDVDGPESDRRPLPDGRTRAAHAPDARACGRPCASDRADRAAVGFPEAAPRVAG